MRSFVQPLFIGVACAGTAFAQLPTPSVLGDLWTTPALQLHLLRAARPAAWKLQGQVSATPRATTVGLGLGTQLTTPAEQLIRDLQDRSALQQEYAAQAGRRLQLWADAQRLVQTRSVARLKLQQAELRLRAAQARLEAGVVTALEVQATKLQRDMLASQVQSNDDLYVALEAVVLATWPEGLPAWQPLPAPPEPLDLSRNPQVLQARLDALRAERELQQARRITVQASAGLTAGHATLNVSADTSWNVSTAASLSTATQPSSWSVGLTATTLLGGPDLSLLEQHQTLAGTQLSRTVALAEVERAQQRIKLQGAQAALTLAAEQVRQRGAALQATQESMAVGARSELDRLDAAIALAEAQQQLQAAQAQRNQLMLEFWILHGWLGGHP